MPPRFHFMLIYFYRKTLLDLHANEREIDTEVGGLTISYRLGYSNRKHNVGKGKGKGLLAFNTWLKDCFLFVWMLPQGIATFPANLLFPTALWQLVRSVFSGDTGKSLGAGAFLVFSPGKISIFYSYNHCPMVWTTETPVYSMWDFK